MKLIGYAFCGSFCTLDKSIPQMELLVAEGWDVMPIVSSHVYATDTRFGTAASFMHRIEAACGRPVMHTIVEAEPLGPKIQLDALIISPCTGNTLAKIAVGITDTPVTMAAKAQLRGNRPVIIALATNDALSSNLKNIGHLMERKHVYFVPMAQDDPLKKPHSMIADFSLLRETLYDALDGRQTEPIWIV